MIIRHILFTIGLILICNTNISAQKGIVRGVVTNGDEVLEYVSVGIPKLGVGTVTDSVGHFEIKNIPAGTYELNVTNVGYRRYKESFKIAGKEIKNFEINMIPDDNTMNEVVVTGTMRTVSRMDSPIPVEVVTPQLFRKNPTPSLFEAIGMVNGVKPQLNCNVCNTGDIHINGMEGPYTMILIDGMPIVSSLSTVYGLSGIPNSLVERIEVVKGPASSLYGSEAMGGIINVITKDPQKAPLVNFDAFATNWREYNIDGSLKFKLNKDITSILGINYFNYQHRKDQNKDNFTDLTLQNRVSIFNKWNFKRKDNKIASLGLRYVYEDRWGGEMNWNKKWRGSDSIYGESIYTNRFEVIGAYQLPVKENIFTQFSYNWHDQNSWYGDTPYMAKQHVLFGQMYWEKKIAQQHNLLLGASFRYTYYDDGTPATSSSDGMKNKPDKTPLPGIFIQDEWAINNKNTLLGGYRYDYDKNHGSVHSPRLAYKLTLNRTNVLRASFGTGFRVVNIFTEDHASLTGAREVIITEKLKPEKSYNGNLNYVLKVPTDAMFIGFDLTGFYSYFTNKIVGDFDSDPNKIIYQNLRGHAVSQGASLNIETIFNFPLSIMAGLTFADVYTDQDNEEGVRKKSQQLHAPKWSGTFSADYKFPKKFTVNLTGTWNGPMRLPILPEDYRPEYSPWFCIANVQLTKAFSNGLEIYGGVKNLFNFVPKDPIMRPFDPFDKHVDDPIDNPKGYTFDPSYNYSSLQGIHTFVGVRYNLWK